MASSTCHVPCVTKWRRLERVVRPTMLRRAQPRMVRLTIDLLPNTRKTLPQTLEGTMLRGVRAPAEPHWLRHEDGPKS
jgi:hypothetical protein